jgi:uncharacterized protein YebE (UPF0316 family)
MSTEFLLRLAALVLMGTISVSLWTVRVALTARGRRLAASLTAGVEAVVFVLVFASVLSSLDSPLEVGGYALGVAAGTLLGVVLDARLSTGQSALRVVVPGDGEALARALQDRGWPLTRLPAEGITGPAALLLLVIDDARLGTLLADLEVLAPESFWAVERLQRTRPSVVPPGYRQVGSGRRGRPVTRRR